MFELEEKEYYMWGQLKNIYPLHTGSGSQNTNAEI